MSEDGSRAGATAEAAAGPTVGFRAFARGAEVPDEVLAGFEGLGTGNVADAMHGHGSMSSSIRPLTTRRALLGRALTVTVSPGNGMMVRRAIARARSGDVLVIDAHGAMERAVLGGNVAIDAIHRGVTGLVVDGVVRDLDELEALGLPVYARGVSPRSGSDLGGRGEALGPIACGGACVLPGDVVVGDADGIVVVPAADAASVGRRAGEIQRRKGSAEDLPARVAAVRAAGRGVYDPEEVRRSLVGQGLAELDEAWRP